MDKKKSKYIKLGIFIVVGLALFVVTIFYIGSKENLFTKTFDLYATFSNVSGLTQGNSVQYAGISVGTIQAIDIIATDKVRVTMNIVSDVQQFIKKDSEASINSSGLVGNKELVISAGNVGTPPVENKDTIHAVKPVDIGDIINNLNESTKEANKIVTDLAEITGKVNNGEGTIGQLINNNDLYDNLDHVMSNVASSSSKVDNILDKASNTINLVSSNIQDLQGSFELITKNISEVTGKINSSQSLVGTLLTDTVFANNIKGVLTNANQTTANLELGSFSFYQNMEALKHNFLFKGYFEDLGYWNREEFEKTMESRETRILNKEHDLQMRELRLKQYQVKLDSLRNILYQRGDSLKVK
ncbi:MAG: MlaD family protein [bacterium]